MSSACRRRALYLLGRRAYATDGLRGKLLEGGFGTGETEATLDWLTELGYLDDAQFAAQTVRRSFEKGYGARRVARDLAARGVDAETARETLESAEGGGISDALMRKLVRGDLSDPAVRRRTVAALARRGFDWDDIEAAVRRHLSGDIP